MSHTNATPPALPGKEEPSLNGKTGMECKIDWLQGTIPMPKSATYEVGRMWQTVLVAISLTFPAWSPPGRAGRGADLLPGFFPYVQGVQFEGIPGTFYWGTINEHILCRFTGKDCEWLRKNGELRGVFAILGEHINRCDFAVDMLTQVSPSSFVDAGFVSTSTTRGFITSDTGETVTIGSRSSDFYARVYRYAEPHPRAKLLRAEIEVKGKAAHGCYLKMLNMDERECVLSVHQRYAWKHAEFRPNQAVPAFRVSSASDKAGRGELLWLQKQVLPALVRYHRENLVDVRAWFTDDVLPEL